MSQNDNDGGNHNLKFILIAVVGACVGIAASRLERHYFGDPGCNCRPADDEDFPRRRPNNPAPYRPQPAPLFRGYRGPQSDGTYWRYEGDVVIGRWNPYTSVYEAWNGSSWVRQAPPVGEKLPIRGQTGDLPVGDK